jgi:hypothetical protein
LQLLPEPHTDFTIAETALAVRIRAGWQRYSTEMSAFAPSSVHRFISASMNSANSAGDL